MIARKRLRRRVFLVKLATLLNTIIIITAGYYLVQAYSGNAASFLKHKDAALQFSGLMSVGTLAVILSYFAWQKEVLHVAARLHPEVFDPAKSKKKWWSSKRMRGFKQMRHFWRLLHDMELLPWWKNPVSLIQLLLVLMFILHRIAMRYLLLEDANLTERHMEIAALIDLAILGMIAALAFITVRLVTRIVERQSDFETEETAPQNQGI